jgi:thiol-disulfide isomerase/thioredoxin
LLKISRFYSYAFKRLLFTSIFFFAGYVATTNQENIGKKSIEEGDITIQYLLNNYSAFNLNYQAYKVKNKIGLSSIEGLKVSILFGTWCHDSLREVPRMLRILEAEGILPNQVSLILLSLKKTEPNKRDKFFNIYKTPTFIFLMHDKEVGRIVERPLISLEADLNNIFKRLKTYE